MLTTVLAAAGVFAIFAVIGFVVFMVGMGAGISYTLRHPEKVFKGKLPGDFASTSVLLIAGRIGHVRRMCESSIEFDNDGTAGLSNRAWLAQSVLNALDGTLDPQIIAEAEK